MAVFDDTISLGGIWRIPAEAVAQFKKEGRKRGRPAKTAAEADLKSHR